MPTFYINHLTKYTYSNTVIDAANRIMLFPINDAYQKVTSQKININSNPSIETHTDYFDNTVGTFMIVEPHSTLIIESEIEVDVYSRMFPEDMIDPVLQWQTLKELSNQTAFIDFTKFKSFAGSEEVSAYLHTFDKNTVTPYQFLQALSAFIFNEFKYIKGITTVNTTLDEVWEIKSGVCQDFTNFMLQACKMMGIPARYVSGYLCPYESFSRGEGATHAWIEAFIPNYGWLGFDPTNNIIATEHHVRLAIGRNYNDCSPVKGVFRGKVEDKLEVNVTVDTTKKFVEKLPIFETTDQFKDANRYQKNLEILQQHQQQQ
jgi:transglutaminase-like putative cysteine protease